MSGPQQSGEPASAPAGAANAAAGDPGNWPGRNAAGGSGHTGGPPSPNKWRRNNSMKYNARPWHQDRADSGPFKNRVWSNYNHRHVPYRQRNNNSNYGSWERPERDYTQRTDYHTNDYHERRERSGEREIDRSPRNPRNPEENYRPSGRYRDHHHYRDQTHRYQSRWSEENTANESISNESSSSSSRDNRNINESIELAESEPNCETSEASKVDQQKDNNHSKKPTRVVQNKVSPSKLGFVNKKNLRAKKNIGSSPSTVASKEPSINRKAKQIKRKDSCTVASKDSSTVAPIDQKTADSEKNSPVSAEVNQVDGLNEDLGLNVYRAHNISGTSPINNPEETGTGTVASKNQQPRRVSRWQRKESNLSKSSENISTTEASSSSLNPPRIQVRPLTQLLKQEILAVTEENRLNQEVLAVTEGNRLSQRPIGSQTPPAPISSPSRPTFKPCLKSRRRTLSSSIQNGGSPSTSSQFAGSEAIINNRIAGMDKESLKYIINNSDTIYDEHLKIQARKRLREEIRRQLKAIELDQPKNNPVTELVEDEIVDAIKLPELLLQEIEKCFGRDFIDGKKDQETEESLDSLKETKGSETEVCEDIQASEVCSKESATTSKDSGSILDSEKSSKNSNEQAFSIESESKVTEESSKNNNCVGAARNITQEDHVEIDNIGGKDKIEKTVIQARKPNRKERRRQSKLEKRMKRSKDLMARLKAADEVKMMAEKRLAQSRGPLPSTPPCGRIPNSYDCPKDQDIGKVESPKKKSKNALAVSESEVVVPSEITAPDPTEVKREHSTSPIRERAPDNFDLPKTKDQDIRKTPSPTQTSKNPKDKSVLTTMVVSPDINKEIKREDSPSPIRIGSFPNGVIELLSSSEEEDVEENTAVDMEIDEAEVERALEIKEQVTEVAPEEPEPATIDDAASDHSASSHCSNESEKRRFKLKLQSDAENVVDSFEKLILPHLRETLSDRYRHQHSGNLQSRLHFISCVVTSSEHNPQTFSKIEVAKIQRNLKAPDNRQGIEFLLREIVSVVNLQKQRRREQEEQVTVNGFSPRKTDQVVSETPKASPSPSSNHTPPTLPIDRRPPILAVHQSPVSLSCHENPSPSGARQSPPGFPALQNPQPYPVGLPFTSADFNPYRFSSAVYSKLRNGADIAEPFGQMGDLLSQNIAEIDRHLMENQNRRSILEEMIMKFQKEKSHLETLSLELQSRKIMLMISSNQSATTAPPPPPRNSSPPASSTQNPVQEENIRQTRSRTRFRRAVLVKLMPKRVKLVPKRATKKSANSEELIAQLHQEIADQEGRKHDQTNEEESSSENQSFIKEELQDESVCDHIAHSLTTVKPKPSPLSKPKTSVSQQPLAIIPPLPPPPPPPESIYHLSDELQPSTDNPQLNSQHHVSFIPQGMLLNVVSPITQIRIYREYVIAAAEDGDIYMFHLISHKLERQITKHSEAITNMFLCEKDSILYTTSLDGFFKKTSLENLERVMQTVYFKEPLQSIDIAWGVAFIGSRWGNIFTYNVATNKQVDMPLLSTGQSIIALKAAKEGVRKILILGCKGSYIHMNDAANGLLLRRLCVPEGQNVYSLLLSNGHIYCGTQKNQIYQFEFVTGNLVTKLNCGNGAVSIVSYKERYLLAGCYDGFIYVLDKATGKQVGRFEGAGRLVLALAVAGDKIVTSSKDNSLGILEVPAEMVNGQ